MFIGVITAAYATYYARQRLDNDIVSGARLSELWDRFPKFVIGFAVMVTLASAGLLIAAQRQSLENAYNWLFLLAFVGLGTELRLEKIRRVGVGPVLVVSTMLCFVSVVSLVILTLTLG